MHQRGPTTRSGKVYREDSENFIYSPLKPRYESEGEPKTSSSSDSEEEISSHQKHLSPFPTPSNPLMHSHHRVPAPPRSQSPPPPPLDVDMVVSMKLPNLIGIGNEDTDHFWFFTEAVWKAQQVNNIDIRKA